MILYVPDTEQKMLPVEEEMDKCIGSCEIYRSNRQKEERIRFR